MSTTLEHIMTEIMGEGSVPAAKSNIEKRRTRSEVLPHMQHCTATTLCGTSVFVELTTAQTLMAGDAWQDDRVLAVEERNGEVILHDVRLGDLCDLQPEYLRHR